MQYRNIIGSEIRKRRDGLGWSQDDLAARLQLAGWDIDRSQVSKIECRLVHVSDFQQLYLARVFKVSIDELYPRMKPQERVDDFLARAMPRRRAPVPRGPRKSEEMT
jgi:transcriptional regulator with XRE-family HTH domain